MINNQLQILTVLLINGSDTVINNKSSISLINHMSKVLQHFVISNFIINVLQSIL